MTTLDDGKRQFILCEQLDYVENITISRVQKIIEGSSFKTAEIKKANAIYSDKIEVAKKAETLLRIWEQIQTKEFVSYKVDPNVINENKAMFEELSLEEQKQFLIEVLDKNQLYVNYSEIDDKDYEISKEDKKLNDQFYSLK